ncbi:2-amino-3-ketobutyrate coenzyme A ligase [Neorhodopirellula lusitana]|uniref:2-amino-3-ketobutyrate coenzyme A ligase n=1 Tax=Neorhodopirellula lusitana TaxID=445327 RepID=A0ABY1PYV8_9BACT|nr:glycine C-acetyltransferase [Neorhodopirellula lusitana]SMP53420.1 2-amino-3-ketobutyrate coenzyme A ligase [Neorhodopirellula lusitana]
MSNSSKLIAVTSQTLDQIRDDGLYKSERVITTSQNAHVGVNSGAEVINLCANNYLGLANHPQVVQAARDSLDQWGYGLASVRFICGTQSIHRQLENRISEFLGTEDTILYGSCFDANGGLFETLLTAEDAIISDSLNHASIIDGIRLCKASRHRYANCDMADLEAQLKAAASSRVRLIATDGVFSMDGSIARLDEICELADRYDASVMVDECHSTGFMGKTGRGTHEHCGVMDRIDVITGTLGKALGGASGGFTSGRKEIVELLRQRSRPYLFSNSVAPPLVAGGLEAIDLLMESTELRDRLMSNAALFRSGLQRGGFNLLPGEHPIIPVMFGDARVATEMSQRLLEKGVYVVGFSYPVVPKGQARIRTQVSAAHTEDDLNFAVECFVAAKQELGI